MPRKWKGSVFSKRGILVVSVRDEGGVWRHRSSGLLDTAENRVRAEALIEELRGTIPARPSKKRIAERTGARERSRFKRRIGPELACEGCGWKPRPPLGARAINAHHIVPRSAGGTDGPENLTALCPNCHAMAHAIYGRKAAPGRAELLAAIRASSA